MKTTIISASVLSLLLLSACATTPDRIETLESARGAVMSLAQDPLASRVASEQLEQARASLLLADTAHADHRPVEEVSHLAYLARQHAAIGKEMIAEARAQEQIANAEAERNEVLLQAREREAAAARSAAASARSDAASARSDAGQAKEKVADLQRELADLAAKPTERGMVLTLGDVLFDTDEANLKPGAASTLDKIATFLGEHPDMRIDVEGHTDSRGSDEYNRELSRRRAEAVASALLMRGVPAQRVQTFGRGEGFPVATNDTLAGRQQNRRVEVIFSDLGGQFAAEPRR